MIGVYTVMILGTVGVLYFLYRESKYTLWGSAVLAFVASFTITAKMATNRTQMIPLAVCMFVAIYGATHEATSDGFSVGLFGVASNVGFVAASIYRYEEGSLKLANMEWQIRVGLVVGLVVLYLALDTYEKSERSKLLKLTLGCLLVLTCTLRMIMSHGLESEAIVTLLGYFVFLQLWEDK